jgi:uncharacterized protein with PIN domain
LPVKRVVLYKNGVGYFEHSARVQGTQELNIDFTTAQLNDVLKSLTVVDLGEGRISYVRYNSIAPLGERLKTLRLPFGEDVSRDDFLSAMRVEIIPITPDIGRGAIRAFERFGRGQHPARLNMGDCFAYACARSLDVPLLFKGDDFSQTDIARG